MLWLYRFLAAVLPWTSRRVVRASVLTLVLCACGLSMVSEARADAPVTMYSTGDAPSIWNSTGQGACDAAAVRYNTAQHYAAGHDIGLVNGGTCSMVWASSPNIVDTSFALISASRCAPNGTAPDTTKPLASQCTPPPPNCAGSDLLNKYRGSGVQGPAPSGVAPDLICVQGCGYTTGSFTTVINGVYNTRLGKATGQACTTGANYDVIDSVIYDETKDNPPSLQSCSDQGKVYGTFNGVGMCATAGSIPGLSLIHI